MDDDEPRSVEPPMVVNNEMVEYVSNAESNVVGDENLEPQIGMEFDSDEDAKLFYDDYARRLGFSVRNNAHYRSRKDNSVICRTFVCSKEGYRRQRNKVQKGNQQPRPITREGCNAMITIKKHKSGKWYVAKFEKKHNHALLSSLRSNQKRKLIDVFNEASLCTSDTTDAVRAEPDVICSVRVTENDCRNCVGRGQLSNRGIDAHKLLDYFNCMQASNPAFFYAIQLNVDESLSNVFWVDARSRISYSRFFDVVCFDTTYKTNRYPVPFAPFLGANHHRQSVLYGCALLSDESEDTFIWLFKTWLEAMSGQYPNVIITDRHKGITLAVTKVFPKTRHCFCKWHILKEVPEKLSHICRVDDNFGGEFTKCVNNTETIHEFELAWRSLLEKYNLHDNEWLQSLYSKREQWVPVYLRDTFLAGMCTSQRSESMNSLFDGYVGSKTTFNDFFRQYEKAVENRYKKEIQADGSSLHIKPVLTTPIPMEEQAAKLYTREVFEIFKEEFIQSLCFTVKRSREDGESNTYLVSKFDENKEYIITFNSSEMRGSCICKMFESEGILCRHLLALFKANNIFTLPSHCILNRWTKSAKMGAALHEYSSTVQDKCRDSMTLRYNSLCQRALEIAELGSTTRDAYKVALCTIQEAKEKIIATIENLVIASPIDSPVNENNQEHNIALGSRENGSVNQGAVRDPRRVTAKGRPQTNTKYKGACEKPVKQKRTCSGKTDRELSSAVSQSVSQEITVMTQSDREFSFIPNQCSSGDDANTGQQLDREMPFIPSQCCSQDNAIMGQSHREVWLFPNQYIQQDRAVTGQSHRGISFIADQPAS